MSPVSYRKCVNVQPHIHTQSFWCDAIISQGGANKHKPTALFPQKQYPAIYGTIGTDNVAQPIVKSNGYDRSAKYVSGVQSLKRWGEKKNHLDATEWFFALIICSTSFGHFMPIIRSSRLYVCYYRLWCAMPWLLVVGGQVKDSRLCVRNEGCYSTKSVEQHPSSRKHSRLLFIWLPTTSNKVIAYHRR